MITKHPVEEETTTTEELENFEKWAKQQAHKSLVKYKDLTTIMKIEDLRNLIIKLNEQQKKILDDFCEDCLKMVRPLFIFILLEKLELESLSYSKS